MTESFNSIVLRDLKDDYHVVCLTFFSGDYIFWEVTASAGKDSVSRRLAPCTRCSENPEQYHVICFLVRKVIREFLSAYWAGDHVPFVVTVKSFIRSTGVFPVIRRYVVRYTGERVVVESSDSETEV